MLFFSNIIHEFKATLSLIKERIETIPGIFYRFYRVESNERNETGTDHTIIKKTLQLQVEDVKIANRLGEGTISSSRTDELFLKKLYEIVEKNLNNADLDVNEFALAVGMSRAQLYRKINAITGQSVKEFIRITRLKKAAVLLLNSNLNISEIAFQVGFNSLAYFTKSFRDYYKISPSNYKADKKKAT